MMELRPYQTEVINDLTTAAAGGARRLLLQAPCGAGKTVIAAKIVSHAFGNGNRVLFLAHRRELVTQCVGKLEDFGVFSGTIMSGDGWDKSHQVDVASIQTLHSWCVRRRHERLPKADLVVIDEAHHYGSSKQWQDIVGAYPEALLLGMTATPINRRGKGLGHFFDVMVKCPTIRQLTEDGYLVPARYFVPSLPDLRGLRVVAGDYVEKDLEGRMDIPKLIGDVVENWARLAGGRQTMVFASGIKHSLHLVEAFRAVGVSASHVDGRTPKEERDVILKDFSVGNTKVLSNCAVFTEGTDVPSASCLVFARPTKSLLLYLQVGGRVLRTFPGKQDAVILDHAGVVYEHGPIDQDWQWDLDYGEGDAKSETQRKIKLRKEIVCKQCSCVYFGKLFCPSCGWKPDVKGKPVATYEGYLQALDDIEREQMAVDKSAWYRQLKFLGLTNGWKSGAVAWKFKTRFGHWPPRGWDQQDPLEPGLEVKAWVRSQHRIFRKQQKATSLNPLP